MGRVIRTSKVAGVLKSSNGIGDTYKQLHIIPKEVHDIQTKDTQMQMKL